jgi:glycosyltransferase involved in cell wall biosynthesis
MAEIRLSVIIPVFNGKKYIQDTLDSLEVLDPLLSCEVIFQNCHSTDGTTDILASFCLNHKNRFHFNEQDQGQSDAINRGMERARGCWVTWLCADDIILPELVSALAEADRAGADVVYGDVIFVQNGASSPAIGTEAYSSGVLAKRRLMIQQPGTCVLRKVWQDASGVQLQLNWAMDYDLFLRLETAQKKFLRIREFLAVIRVHPEAKTSSGSIYRMFELWSILWQSHKRKPVVFRLRPYFVYGVEYIIKSLEQANAVDLSRLRRVVLFVLHRFFWLAAGAVERQDIQQRFQNLPVEVTLLIHKMAGRNG